MELALKLRLDLYTLQTRDYVVRFISSFLMKEEMIIAVAGGLSKKISSFEIKAHK